MTDFREHLTRLMLCNVHERYAVLFRAGIHTNVIYSVNIESGAQAAAVEIERHADSTYGRDTSWRDRLLAQPVPTFE